MSIDTNQNISAIVTLEEDGDDLILPLPDEILDALNWNENEVLEWIVQPDNTIILRSIQMKDQNTILDGESKQDKWNRGLDIFIESVIEPDHALRACAHNQKCYHELMDVRQNVLNYLKTLRWN